MRLFVVGIIFFLLLAFPIKTSATLDRLGIRTGSIGQEFYNVRTGRQLHLRENNYIRSNSSTHPTAPMVINNFNVGIYDRTRHVQALDVMKKYGYNAIRVIFASKQTYSPTNPDQMAQYVANVTDFLTLAEARNI